ncbi:hypothetical protein ACUNI2_18455 [Serratia sp. IR-2025]
MDKFSELSRPVRIHRDWNRASMCHCGKCDRWEMTIADADGVQTCASCYDAEWLSEWQNYAEAAEKRITELEAEGKVWESAALKHLERAEEAEKRLATPVGFYTTVSGRGGVVWHNGTPEDDTAIYTAPPAPAVPTLPTALLDAMDEVLRISDRDHEAWDKAKSAITACRAAMLAQPVSSSYTLPEGFKLMPLEMTDEIGEAIAMEARCCGTIALCIYEAALAAAPEGGNG